MSLGGKWSHKHVQSSSVKTQPKAKTSTERYIQHIQCTVNRRSTCTVSMRSADLSMAAAVTASRYLSLGVAGPWHRRRWWAWAVAPLRWWQLASRYTDSWLLTATGRGTRRKYTRII